MATRTLKKKTTPKKQTVAKSSSSKNQQKENNMISKTTLDIIEDAYTVYGKDIMWNSYQQGRAFLSADDGLKISYRHILQTMLETTGSAMTKVQAILGENMKRYHFHGDLGAEEIVYSLANDYGCVECQGNSGARTMSLDMKGSAPRYVEARLKKTIRDQLEKVMPFVPTEKTVTGYDEKLYIPSPIPLGLIAGSPVSMGVGMRNNIPAFTAESLLEAYLANDPSLLKVNYGYTLGEPWKDGALWDNSKNTTNFNIADKVKPTKENLSELKSLWTDGRAILAISIPIYWCKVDDIEGYLLVCDPALHKPKISSKLEEWEENGWIEIQDYSDTIGKMFIAKTKGTRKISDDDIYDELVKKCNITKRETFELNIATEFITGRVGLYDWLNHTYRNYTQLYQKYITKELDGLDFMERVWRNFRFIANQVIKYKKSEKSDNQIIKECNSDPKQKKLQIGKDRNGKRMIFDCDEEVFKYISSKPINTLRSEIDIDDRLDKIAEDRDFFNNVNIDNEIVDFCSVWDNL